MAGMMDILQKARQDATAIFQAGLRAVAPDGAVGRFCERQGEVLTIGGRTFDLSGYDNVYIVGAGWVSI
jgi:hypothetical protein